MSTLRLLFDGMVASAQQGDWATVDGACRAALLLLAPSGEENTATPAQALSALRPVLPVLPAEGVGAPASLVRELARRGAPRRTVRLAVKELWGRAMEVADTRPEEDRYWMALGGLVAGDKELRAELGASKEARLLFDREGGEGLRLFAQMLRAPDDLVLVVLHPDQGRGYRLRASGVTDLAQLQVLLGGLLIGEEAEGLLPGHRPCEAAIRACGYGVLPLVAPEVVAIWNPLAPAALSSAGLSDESGHWLWGENSTATIPRWEGTATLLLGPMPYQRSWQARRSFEELPGKLVLEEILPRATASQLLEQLARSND